MAKLMDRNWKRVPRGKACFILSSKNPIKLICFKIIQFIKSNQKLKLLFLTLTLNLKSKDLEI